MLNALISLLILAQEDGADYVETTSNDAAQGNPWSGIIMMVAIIAIFYFLMIRPQQKKQKEIKKFREGIKAGDKVITAGGIHGKVTSVKEDTFTVQIAPEVTIKIDKGSVYPVGAPGQEAPLKENA
ncbi:MAG: preprotein translocase subunit YajC [Bacteroides sp.]|nr:preprotein translocase subunit YajC [Bacteroides sp.]